MSLEQSIPHRGCLLKSHGHDPGLPVLTVRERKTKLTYMGLFYLALNVFVPKTIYLYLEAINHSSSYDLFC